MSSLPPAKNDRPHHQVLRPSSRIDIHTAIVDRISCVILTLGLWMIPSSTYIPQKCWLIRPAHCLHLCFKDNCCISQSGLTYQNDEKVADLFTHGLRICDSSAEVTVPFQSSIQSRPVIMSVSRMRKTPRNKGVKLPVSGVTGLAFGAWAYTA